MKVYATQCPQSLHYIYATDPAEVSAMVHLKLDSWSKEIFQNSNREISDSASANMQPGGQPLGSVHYWVVGII